MRAYEDDWGRIRFYCLALKDELELSSVLCQELVHREGILCGASQYLVWMRLLLISIPEFVFKRQIGFNTWPNCP